MKCQEFVLVVRDLARQQGCGGLLDAEVQMRGLAHAEECVACAARLADERQLSAGLRTWSLSEESLGAGANVESALLAAFRQQQLPSAQPTMIVQRRIRWPRWALAAAVLLIGLLTWALRGWLPGTGEVTQSPPMLANASPSPAGSPGETVVPTSSREALPEMAATPEPVQASPKRPRARYRVERYLVESEIATDFLPLTAATALPQPEALQTIRVEVPRAVLARFGLPMSFERATEPVKADLLIGNDGLARAIRFVQTDFDSSQILSANNLSSNDQ